MDKRIHAGSRSDKWRHTNRQFGVGDHNRRQYSGMKNDLFDVALTVDDDAGSTDLRPRACGRWYGDDGGNPIGIRAFPPVTNILEVPHRPGLTGHEGQQFTQVQPGPSAEGDHAVVVAVEKDLPARFHVDFRGVGINL